jgi:hypothetical protein
LFADKLRVPIYVLKTVSFGSEGEGDSSDAPAAKRAREDEGDEGEKREKPKRERKDKRKQGRNEQFIPLLRDDPYVLQLKDIFGLSETFKFNQLFKVVLWFIQIFCSHWMRSSSFFLLFFAFYVFVADF